MVDEKPACVSNPLHPVHEDHGCSVQRDLTRYKYLYISKLNFPYWNLSKLEAARGNLYPGANHLWTGVGMPKKPRFGKKNLGWLVATH